MRNARGACTRDAEVSITFGCQNNLDLQLIKKFPVFSWCTQIFDDDDFYHTLLRDLIDKKAGEGAGSGGGDLAQKVAQIQKLRSKSKRKVDTRASKGRRIRYDIHAKLVNFTAPVAGVSTISEEARNELFGSLFK